jgi:NADPH:quinone reductase-like Zn-dependent oxidoreductase
MKALGYNKAGAENVLKLEDIEKPLPHDDEVLIEVRAASVNPLDSHLAKHPFLRGMLASRAKVKVARPGRDVAGQVVAAGSHVTQFKLGDEVFGACNGAFAEYVCARERALTLKPHNISFEQPAAVPIAGLTALQALRDKAHIQRGQSSG